MHQSRLSNAGTQHQTVTVLQVYLLLDEFIMGGELQETSKKASLVCKHAHDQRTQTSVIHRRRAVACTDALCDIVQVVLERLAELDKIET